MSFPFYSNLPPQLLKSTFLNSSWDNIFQVWLKPQDYFFPRSFSSVLSYALKKIILFPIVQTELFALVKSFNAGTFLSPHWGRKYNTKASHSSLRHLLRGNWHCSGWSPSSENNQFNIFKVMKFTVQYLALASEFSGAILDMQIFLPEILCPQFIASVNIRSLHSCWPLCNKRQFEA